MTVARPSLERTAGAEERVGEPIRPEIDVDAIEMNLGANDDGPQQAESSLFALGDYGPGDVGAGGERAFDVWRVAASRRQRSSDGVGVGQEGPEAFDDHALEFGRRQALSGARFAFVL